MRAHPRTQRRRQMAKCQECGDDTDEIVRLKFGRRTLKLCEDCAEVKREELEMGEISSGIGGNS